MKKKNTWILLLVFIICACSSKKVLVGKKYIATTEYDSMILDFHTQDECVFTHSFIPCGMDERFQSINIICNYKIKNNIITLENKYPIDSLSNVSSIAIPEKELKKCAYMNLYTISGRKPYPPNVFLIGAPPVYNNGDYIGFLNYIHKEKLLYRDSLIFYQKSTYKKPHPIHHLGTNYRQKYKDCIFVQEGYHADTLSVFQEFRKASINMETPLNYIEEK